MKNVYQSVAVIKDCASNKLFVARMELFMIGVLTIFPDFLFENG